MNRLITYVRGALIVSVMMVAFAATPASAVTVNHQPCGYNNMMPRIDDPANTEITMERPAFHSDCPTYKGWGHASAIGPDSCIWMGCRMASLATSVTGYHWEGGGWHAHAIPVDDWVYAWPYTGGWSWAYHYDTHTWVAMKSTNITILPTENVY